MYYFYTSSQKFKINYKKEKKIIKNKFKYIKMTSKF